MAVLHVNVEGITGNQAKVTESGAVVVAPIAYDDTQFLELAEINTAYNFWQPRAGRQFVITNIICFGDKQVSNTTNSTVVIYEAADAATTTEDKILLQFEVGQNQSLVLSPLNLLVNKGKFINAKCDDDDIHMTIMGYYLPAIDTIGRQTLT